MAAASGPAALLLSAAQLAALNGLGLNQAPYRAIVGQLNNGATQQPLSLTDQGSQTSTSDLPNNTDGQAYTIQFDVVVEEQHTDELTITDHPVEQGAAITDNAFKNPAMVVLNCGMSASGSVKGNLFSGGGIGNPLAISNPLANAGDAALLKFYAFLLQVQTDRTPMTVYTGKRTYPNMLLKSIATNSSDRTEHSLPLTLVFREVILVQTMAVTVTTQQSLQSAPQDTTPTVSSGVQQLQPAPLYVPLDSTLAGPP